MASPFEKGTQENPFSSLREAFDAADGSGKTYWVNNPDANLVFHEMDIRRLPGLQYGRHEDN